MPGLPHRGSRAGPTGGEAQAGIFGGPPIGVAIVATSGAAAAAGALAAVLEHAHGFLHRRFACDGAAEIRSLPAGRGGGFVPAVAVVALESGDPAAAETIFAAVGRAFPGCPLLVLPPPLGPEEVCALLGLGACEFLLPPLRPDDVLPRLLHQALTTRRGDPLVARVKANLGLAEIIGESPALLREVQRVPRLARCEATVLISGESGTGKEVFARAIHYLSARAGAPFVPVNCGAIPEHLIESEIFGHKRGAFTGAVADQPGLIREAESGSLFLDEIDALTPASQVKLLRFLQDGEYRAVGAQQVARASVRVIVAANADFDRIVREGRFREDLFYRLNVLRLALPPLRERAGDVVLLARHFLARRIAADGLPARTLSPAAIGRLLRYPWPGNVRELENAVTRACVLAEGELIEPADFALPGDEPPVATGSFRAMKARAVREFERDYLETALRAHEGNITRAARAAGKNRRAFWELLRKHGLVSAESPPERAGV